MTPIRKSGATDELEADKPGCRGAEPGDLEILDEI